MNNDVKVIYDMPADEYHKHHSIGSSQLWDFHKRRGLYYQRYVTGELPGMEETPAMRLGTMVHTALLEPTQFPDRYAAPFVRPMKDDGTPTRANSNAYKDAFKKHAAANAGRIIPTQEDHDTTMAIAMRAQRLPIVRKYLNQEGKRSEVSVFWTDDATGLLLKIRVDLLAAVPLDIKTTRDASPKEFIRSAASLGYHLKKAHYLAGLRAAGFPEAMVYLAIETAPPFSMALYNTHDDGAGEKLYRETLQDLRDCQDGVQPWCEEWEGEVLDLDYPAWAVNDFYQLEN